MLTLDLEPFIELKRLVLLLQDLEYMASAGLRVLLIAKNRLGTEGAIYLIGTQDVVLDTIQKVGLHRNVTLLDEL